VRLTRFEDQEGRVHVGEDLGDGTAQPWAGEGVAAMLGGEPHGPARPVARRLAPLVPANIFCIGLNYHRHAEESGAEVGPWPVLFMKPTSTVIDPGTPIRIPAAELDGPEVDYEVELAVVIGRAGRDIPVAQALEHVLGYTVANDVSARRWQKRGGGGQWIRGKSFDTFCPLGPVLATPQTIPDPQTLGLRTTLNGELMQSSSTADMIWPVAELIAFVSRDTTLLPGTVLLTGTPEGVGFAQDPARFLKPGDMVSVAVEGVGELVNPVLAAV